MTRGICLTDRRRRWRITFGDMIVLSVLVSRLCTYCGLPHVQNDTVLSVLFMSIEHYRCHPRIIPASLSNFSTKQSTPAYIENFLFTFVSILNAHKAAG
jgi:hypothetical protein